MDKITKQEATPFPEGKRFRFTIVHLFYVIALLASGLVVMGPWSLGVTTTILALWALLYSDTWRTVGFCILIILFLIGLFWPAVQSARSIRNVDRNFSCMNNMRQMILATLNYESAHGTLPPAVKVNENGEPMHSWRALVLPFLGGHPTYQFNEPWNGPNNKLATDADFNLQCPSSDLHPSQTTYKWVTGEGSTFPDGSPVKLSEITDGTANTIVMIEDRGNPINWLEPTDLTIEEAVKVLSTDQLGHAHRTESLFTTKHHGTNVAFMDGSTCSIRPNSAPELIRRALLISDGQTVDLESITGDYVVHKPSGYFALAIYLMLLALPGYLLLKKQRVQ